MPDSILTARDGAIATVTLNQPQRRNALNRAMWERLGEVMTELSADDSLRCVILRGAGDRAFGAGADIAEFERERADARQAADYGRVVDRAMDAVLECPHPTLALIQGACIGGGLELAVQCDLRLCNSSARFGIPINRIGHCLPYGGMVALVELVGRATALEILLEGRVIDAQEAYAKGLVSRALGDPDFEEEAQATAQRIAAGAPLAARAHKVFARRALDPKGIAEAEWDDPYQTCDSADYREGVRAFLAKETPVFKGR